MNKCPQCGAAISEKKAFCGECGGTMVPSKKPPPRKGLATTVRTGRAAVKPEQPADAKPPKRPSSLSIYWKKRKRTDE